MSSWFMQLHATGQLEGLATVVGGVFFAGGTYGCYNNPPSARAQCAHCNASDSCLQIGCSNKLASQGITPCCQYCCPEGFTEAWYNEHPENYSSHPATFLVQHSTLDENADTCAARNYHAEMLKNGGDSTLVLIPSAQERCFCLGNPGVASDALSPYRGACASFLPGIGNTSCTLPPNGSTHHQGVLSECQEFGPASGERCVNHMMAFGGMVLPHTEFVLRVTRPERQGLLKKEH